MGDDSGTGVAFTRDPNTGEKTLFGEYLTNAQGEDVVAGIRTAPKISQMATDMPEVYAEFGRIGQQLETPLPRRPGPRVHDRARQAVHAPDTIGEAHRRRRHQDRGRPRRRGRHQQGRGADAHRAGARRPAPARPVRPRRPSEGDAHRQGPERVARRRRRAGRVRRGCRGRVGRPRREGRARPDRDLARRLPRHGRGRGDPDRPRRGHVARGRRRAPDRQAVRGRLPRARDRLRGASARDRQRRRRSRRATGSASTASTGEVFVGSLPTVSARFEDQPELQRVLGWADEVRRMQVWTNADKPEEAALARTLRRAGHRPVPHRAHVPRGRAARDRPRRDPRRRWSRPGPRPRPRPAETLSDDDAAAVARFDAAMGKLEVLQQGDFEGIFKAMDGCRSSSGSSTRRSTSSCRTSRTSWSR